MLPYCLSPARDSPSAHRLLLQRVSGLKHLFLEGRVQTRAQSRDTQSDGRRGRTAASHASTLAHLGSATEMPNLEPNLQLSEDRDSTSTTGNQGLAGFSRDPAPFPGIRLSSRADLSPIPGKGPGVPAPAGAVPTPHCPLPLPLLLHLPL